MDDFNLVFFVDELNETFNHKKSRLGFDLHVVGWEIDITWLNADDPEIGEIVNGIVQSTAKRREFEQKQDWMLREEADTIQESVNEWIFLAAINWYAGGAFVESDWRDGIRFLLKSIELLDMCHGIIKHELWQQSKAEEKEQAAHGGKAKAALYAPLKAEVIRLLASKKPVEGWKSKNSALNAIDKDICMFIEQHGFPGLSGKLNMQNELADVFTRIPRLLSDWSRNDADVKAAFETAVRQKKKSTPKGA